MSTPLTTDQAPQAGYFVDRVVICDAYSEPNKHYELLAGGRSRLVETRRPSMRYLSSAKDSRGGISGVIGRRATLFDDLKASEEQHNTFVNSLRDEVRQWRQGDGTWSGNSYGGTALVTRRLLEWWFERDDERKAEGKRFFYCQQEAVETVIYLYEVKLRHRMPETGDLIRYALKLATGTGKTVVMSLLVTWSTLHKARVSGSTLSSNFLVLVPNLTVRDRVSGVPRGDGLDPTGDEALYYAFDMVPPEYRDEFRPNVIVKNWQAISLEMGRDDAVPTSDLVGDGRFLPASVIWALQRRSKGDPNTPIRRVIGNWRDLVIINDEAHHVYGEKRTKKGEDAQYIKWTKIIERLGKAARIPLVLDLSATPWYGSGSPKPEGTLFEWLVSDFSVYDAFESGLVKVVRLPDPETSGSMYLDLWDLVKDAKTKEEYLSACKGAIATIYSDWREDYANWNAILPAFRTDPAPVMLVVADRAERAQWLFEHLSADYELLRNPDHDNRLKWVTLRIDSGIFDAEKGTEATIREMVNTVGRSGQPGEHVRCIVSVNMLSEGWDVKSVTHIIGIRAFGSPLLTEQIIGRGLRRTDYTILNQPLDERPLGSEETVDAFGIPFIGFPVQKRKRQKGDHGTHNAVWIQPDDAQVQHRLRIPNVRAWAVGVQRPLTEVINVLSLPELTIDPKQTPAQVSVKPVVGGKPEDILTLNTFRLENPLMKSVMLTAQELLENSSPGTGSDVHIGPTFDELLDLVQTYVDTRVRAQDPSDPRDLGIYFWRRKMLDTLNTSVQSVGHLGIRALPILGTPEHLDTANLRRFQWTGLTAQGTKTHTTFVPCHSPLERDFANFLDAAPDVLHYFKNERLGFSITYYEHNRPRQYYPDFIVLARDPSGAEVHYLIETKGEIYPNTATKSEAARLWCQKMSTTTFGPWLYLFVPQPRFVHAQAQNLSSLNDLAMHLG
jgi:type III restriction enzyme